MAEQNTASATLSIPKVTTKAPKTAKATIVPAAGEGQVAKSDPIAQARETVKNIKPKVSVVARRQRRSPVVPKTNNVQGAADATRDSAATSISAYLNGTKAELEAEGTAEGTAEAAPTTEAQGESNFPEWLVSRMAEHDLNPSDFSSPEAASKFITRLRSQNRKTQPATQQTQQAEQAKQFDPFDSFDRKAFASEFGEHGDKLLGVIDRIHSHYAGQFNTLVRGQMGLHTHLQNQRTATIDEIFDGSNADYQNAFGAGSVAQLDPDSVEYRNRIDVAETAQQILNGPRGQGLSLKAAFKRAIEITLGPAKAKAPATKPAKAAKQVVEPAADASDEEADDLERVSPALARRQRMALGFSNGHSGRTMPNSRAEGLAVLKKFLPR